MNEITARKIYPIWTIYVNNVLVHLNAILPKKTKFILHCVFYGAIQFGKFQTILLIWKNSIKTWTCLVFGIKYYFFKLIVAQPVIRGSFIVSEITQAHLSIEDISEEIYEHIKPDYSEEYLLNLQDTVNEIRKS